MRLIKILVLSLIVSCNASNDSLKAYDAISGQSFNVRDILAKKELFIYFIQSDVCAMCASEILSYSTYNSQKELPSLLVITSDSAKNIIDGVNKNIQSGIIENFKKTHYITSIASSEMILSSFNIPIF